MTRPEPRIRGPLVPPDDATPSPKQGKIRTAVHQVMEGLISWSVSPPESFYGTTPPPITHRFGPHVMVFNDEASARSFLASVKELERRVDLYYPDLEALAERQADERHYVNGGPSQLEKSMAAARRDGAMSDAQLEARRGNMKMALAWQIRQQTAGHVPYRQIAEMGRAHGWELTTPELTDIRTYASSMPLSEHRQLREKNELSRIDQIAMELLGFDEPVIEPAKELGAVVAQEGASL